MLYELNELDRATKHLLIGLKVSQQFGDVSAEKLGLCLLAKVQLAKGDLENAEKSIRNAEKVAPGTEVTFELRGVEHLQIRFWFKK